MDARDALLDAVMFEPLDQLLPNARMAEEDGYEASAWATTMDEMLRVMADLWDNGWAEQYGEFFDVLRVGMFPVPVEAPPIWVGGRSEAALRRAVRHDGWLGMNYGLDEIEALVARLGDLRLRRRAIEIPALCQRLLERRTPLRPLANSPLRPPRWGPCVGLTVL